MSDCTCVSLIFHRWVSLQSPWQLRRTRVMYVFTVRSIVRTDDGSFVCSTFGGVGREVAGVVG